MVVRSEEPAVTVRRIASPLLAWRLWRLYDAALSPINRLTPCRQSFHRRAFLRLMADPRVLKLTVGMNGIDGFAAVTCRLALLPWVSESYFDDQQVRTGRRYAYVPILVVGATSRGRKFAPALIQALRSTCAAAWGVRDLGFDVGTGNGALPLLMKRVLGSTAHVEPIGAQRYFCASEH